MSTSGSIDFNRTGNQIVTRALKKVGAVEQGESPRVPQIVDGVESLNIICKSLQAETTFTWKVDWLTETMTASSEVTGTNSNIYTCIRNHTSATANKPVTGADWTTYWKLKGSTGGTWAASTDYTSIGNISLDVVNNILGITEAFWRNDTTDTPMTPMTRKEYMEQSDKSVFGIPTRYWVDFTTIGRPKVFLWPIPDVTVSNDLTQVFHYAAITRIEDFDAGANNPDFDVQWLNALTYLLAADLSYDYGIPLQERTLLELKAEGLKKKAIGGTGEHLDLDVEVRI